MTGGVYDYKLNITELIDEDNFQNQEYKEIFRWFKAILFRKDEKNLDVVLNKNKYAKTFEELADSYISGATYRYWCDLLIDISRKDFICKMAEEIKLSPLDYKTITTKYNRLINPPQKDSDDDNIINNIMDDYYNGFDAVKSGYFALDEKTNGFFGGELIILGGSSSMGKTATALNIAFNSALAKKRTLIISLEMKKEELVKRLICAEANISADKMRARKLSADEQELMVRTYEEKIKPLPIKIVDDSSLKMNDIRALCLKEIKNGLDFVVIDYLGLVKSSRPHSSKYLEVSDISRELKLLAGELNVPIMTLCQLSRSPSERQNKRPMLSDLRDSGSIEQDADIVILVYRDEYFNPHTDKKGFIELIIPKHRHGATGVCELMFNKTTQKIYGKSSA